MNSTKVANVTLNMTKQNLLVKNITVNKSNAANISKNQTKNVTAVQSKTQATSIPAVKLQEKVDKNSHSNDSRAKRVEIIQT